MNGQSTHRRSIVRRTVAGALVLAAVGAALVGGALSLAGCGTPAEANTVTVEMKGLRFQPSDITIDQGTKVIWINKDEGTAHTSTAEGWQEGTTDPTKWNSMPMNPGESFERVFDTAGTFDYFCMVHSYMKGVVKVRDANGNVPPPETTTTSGG